MRNLYLPISPLLAFWLKMYVSSASYSQTDGNQELFVKNMTEETHTFDATAGDNVRWERDGAGFKTTTQYKDVDAIQVPADDEKGWDFVNTGGGSTGNGTLAYSKYKIWTGSDYVYLDYRDTYYITENFVSIDVYLLYYGDGLWEAYQVDFSDTIQIETGDTFNIWTLIDRSNPDQEGFKIPVIVDNNFNGGQVKIDNVDRSTPYNADWSLNSSHSISAISPQNVGGGNYVWCFWSDDGAQTHNVSVDGTSYSLDFTAKFVGTYITGPGYLTKGQTGTYDCNPTCASGNCSYQWYKKYDGSEFWYTLGTAQTQQITMHSTPFTVKVEVTDDDYDKTATATKYVTNELLGKGATDGSDSAAFSTILQNYPIPFNPRTTIGYRLLESAHVTLKVYDVRGQEVVTLVDGWQSAGKHTVSFDASQLTSGIYWYQLQVGNASAIKIFSTNYHL